MLECEETLQRLEADPTPEVWGEGWRRPPKEGNGGKGCAGLTSDL